MNIPITTKVFRFDDVCINANMGTIYDVVAYLKDKFPDCRIIFGMSPLVHNNCGERVFPKILNAMSDYKNFYKVDSMGFPSLGDMASHVETAGHGLAHVDHRLLHFAAQEMSILVSCSLAKSKIFIPPFNKWNADTDKICKENGIHLVKFEDGWLSMEHNEYKEYQNLWYLHARDFDLASVMKWYEKY